MIVDPADMAAPVQQEPVAWRYRTKASWESEWSNWIPCSQGQYNDYVRVSRLHDWTYEAQALCIAAPVHQKPLSECMDGEIYARISALAAPAAKVPKITTTRIANHLKKSPLGDISMYRNGFFDGAKWAAPAAKVPDAYLIDALRDAACEIECCQRPNTHVLEKVNAAIKRAEETPQPKEPS